jgi:hypothetical protein
MIQAILSFQFVLHEMETGEIEPEFIPIQLIFKEKKFTKEDFSDLITKTDIFSIFYHHTTSVHEITGAYSNFYSGRLKNTPYNVISYFKQETTDSQYLAISLFSLNDELAIFESLIKSMGERLDVIFETLDRAKNMKQISLIDNINKNLEKELKFAIFQVERLSNLDKLQKVALIFNNEERIKILNILRECPISKRELRDILENIKENSNIDLLIEPFLELNLLRRDWIKGRRDKNTGLVKQQGEYLFLIKDLSLIRLPNANLLNHLKDTKHELYEKYKVKVAEFFSQYDPSTQSIEDTKKLASILLNPDIYDLFSLIRNKFYPLDKIPNIFSEFADVDLILDELKNLKVITEIKDEHNRSWIFLLTDIKPLIFFPEYLLIKLRDACKTTDKHKNITYEIAEKALELLEVAYPEKVEF